jgi:hypothetical protein
LRETYDHLFESGAYSFGGSQFNLERFSVDFSGSAAGQVALICSIAVLAFYVFALLFGRGAN